MTFFQELSKVYTKDRLLTDKEMLSPYESDGLTAFAVTPRGVVIPETADEVIETVRICARHKVPFVARGSGTSLSGASLPVEEGIVIALNRLNQVLELDPKRRIAKVEPGVINLNVSKAAQPYGLHYAPDPSSQVICTIGGNIAFNSGGAHCLKYGMTANHVLGIKAVLATGEVVEFGGDSLESNGPDYHGLFCGSEGMFGVVLEATLRLLPKAEMFHTVLVGYDNTEKAGDTVAEIVASGMLPGAMEIMDRLAIDAAEAAVNACYPKEAQAVLIVELEGPAEQVECERKALGKIIQDSTPLEVHVAKDSTERMMIWKGRKSAFSAVGRLSPDFIVQDGVVPRKRLGEALRRIDDYSEKHGLRVANVFHAGDGNLHPLILYNGSVEGELEKAEALAGEILEMCIEMGGSITGEHGIGMEKRPYLPKMFSETDINFQKATRAAFDPDLIANPGKMFPEGQAPALVQSGLHPLEKEGIASRN